MKWNTAFAGVAATAALATGQVLFSPQQVDAGTNGQRVRVNTGGYMRVVSFEGRNQNGQVVKVGPYTSNGGVDMPGWWKGNVTVVVDQRNTAYVWLNKPRTRTCTFNIPTFQIGDWVTVTCD